MKERRFLVFRPGHAGDQSVQLLKEEKAHLNSLRLKPSEIVFEIRDGLGKAFTYLPNQSNNPNFELDKAEDLRKEKDCRVAMAFAKGTRFDFFLEKATELGATELYFLEWDRSIRKEFNRDRSLRILAQAGAQSKRSTLPSLITLPFHEFLEQFGDRSLLLDPASEKSFANEFKPGLIPLVGPEGGFSELEKKSSLAKVQKANLGEGILRLETASLAVLAWQRISG